MEQVVAALLLFTSVAMGQVVQPPPGVPGVVVLTGVVQPDLLPSTCNQGTHTIDCSSVRLQSSNVDLDALIGRNVRLRGIDVGVECPVYEVLDFSPPPVELTLCGSPVPGCGLRLRSTPGALSQHWLLASGFSGFMPVDTIAGSFMLGTPFLIVGTELSGSVEGIAFDFTLPETVSLTGITLFLQSARRDVGPVGPVQFSNPICFTILGPSPPCVAPDC